MPWKTELPEPVDYVIGELMSIYCANEFQVPIFKHLRQFLKPDGKLLPEKIINLAQLGFAELDAKYKHFPLMFTRHLPMFVSTQEIVNITDLYTENELHIQKTIQMKALLSGTVNSVLLSSWVQVKEGVNFTGTDSLMPPTVVALEKPVTVKEGDTIHLHCDYTYATSLDEAKFWVE